MGSKKIALALQGGGAHGAYTWGVLERLLEEDILDIRGICGTSAGAVNAALTVYGLHKDGHEGAIDLLERFWRGVSASSSSFILPQQQLIDNYVFKGNMDYSPYYQLFNFITNHFSPSQFNPFSINPIIETLGKLIDFEELNRSEVKLFAGATNVRTGSPKVFSTPHMTLDSVMASACLPYLFKTVKLDDEYYWDGGYSGNPPLYPLIYGTDADDIMLIQIIPMYREQIPGNVTEIYSRLNEIGFNTALKAEMRMIMNGYDVGGELRKVFFQLITSDHVFKELDFSSTLNTSWDFLNKLRKEGRADADYWLKNEVASLGRKTSPILTAAIDKSEKDWCYEMAGKHCVPSVKKQKSSV